MKKLTFIIVIWWCIGTTEAQVSGNINYQNQVRYSDQNINVILPANADLLIGVKGLANVKADTYVAIFAVNQSGKTAEETNQLINGRISTALGQINGKAGVETYVDMVSFVPVYEYETEKKVFSKRTYNEIPVGFELKKNIHIKYSDPNLLNEIITALTSVEIYDLVRVDYFANTLEAVKRDLMTKAKAILQDKHKNYQSLLGKPDSANRQLADGFKVVLPVEMYKSYEAYSSSSLNLKKAANITTAAKSPTLYYQPVIDKEFDFVINPTILEPVIQVMYEIKLLIKREQQLQMPKSGTEYYFIAPNGEMKKLDIRK
jgi:uncharacterized protein YggE